MAAHGVYLGAEYVQFLVAAGTPRALCVEGGCVSAPGASVVALL